MARLTLVICLLVPVSAAAQPPPIADVKVRFHREKDRQWVDKDAQLTLEDSARRIRVSSKERALDVAYDDVLKIIIEPDRRVSIGPGEALAWVALGVDRVVKTALVVYLEYKKPDGSTAPFVLSIGKDAAPVALKRFKAAFGDQLLLPAFEGTTEKIDEKQLEAQSKAGWNKHEVRGNAQEHPTPELRPDKALVVIACPTGGGLDPVSSEKWWRTNLPAILVNDQVLGVNAPGTYTYFHLDPGDYLLVSPGASGLRIKVEAGRDYYLIQQMHVRGTFLMQHSRELVMHYVSNSLWSEWRPKQ